MKIRKVFTCFLIILMNFTMFNTAHANTIAGSGWDITGSIVDGATTTFNATKTKMINGASVAIKGVAKITPTGPQIGKMILRTGLTLAVTVALQELVSGVDFVLDPANNSITYKYVNPSDLPNNSQYRWILNFASSTYPVTYCYSNTDCATAATARSAATNSNGLGNSNNKIRYDSCAPSGTAFICSGVNIAYGNTTTLTIYREPNPAYGTDSETRSIGVDVVGAQIATDAASKDEARVYTNSVANTITAPNEDDQLVPATEAIGQFDNTASYPSDTTSTQTTTTTNPDGTTSTETKTSDYPAACAWMPSVCEFASNAIDFMKPDFTEPDAVDTPTREISQQSLSPNLYNYGSSCPADRTLSMNIVGRPFTKTFSFSEICSQLQVLSNLVMAGAYVYGALIIARGV